MLERLKRCRAPIRSSQVREAVGGGGLVWGKICWPTMAVLVKRSNMLNPHVLNLHHVLQRSSGHWSCRENESPFFKSLQSSGYNGDEMSWQREAWDLQSCGGCVLHLRGRSGLLAQRKRPAQRELLKHPSTEEITITGKPNHSPHHSHRISRMELAVCTQAGHCSYGAEFRAHTPSENSVRVFVEAQKREDSCWTGFTRQEGLYWGQGHHLQPLSFYCKLFPNSSGPICSISAVWSSAHLYEDNCRNPNFF